MMKIEYIKYQVDQNSVFNAIDKTEQLFKKIQKQQEDFFENILRTVATPPIKGEITKGKLRWRGIRLVTRQEGFDCYSWLEQRGKQIGPKFHIEAKLPDLNVGKRQRL